jgi:iron-sulfur cluster repair protein YtfE (RIC family)
MRDAVRDLTHDHQEINRRVRAVSAKVQQLRDTRVSDLTAMLDELREQLFLHFAREEEGLFPFVAEVAPALSSKVHDMAVAHDTICGALARACYLAHSGADAASLVALYERFEQAYAMHSAAEADVLATIDGLLDAGQRERLASLVDGL